MTAARLGGRAVLLLGGRLVVSHGRVLVAGWQLAIWGVFERVAVSLFPGGTTVPLSVIRTGGPVATGPPLVASTSMDVVKQAVADRYCRVPPPAPVPPMWREQCWSDLQPPSGTLLIATVDPFCGPYERFAILRDRTLLIRVVDRCPDPPTNIRVLPQPTYDLLGVPVDRLPRGPIAVEWDDDRLGQATVSIPAP